MSTEGQSGISSAELNYAIDALRADMQSEIRALRSEMQREIERLEREMREVGVMIVSAIDKQTVAVLGGVAATTVMLERTKQQIESDFQLTRGRIEVQTESTLQIEIGKKLADAIGFKGKLEAFFQDIRTRYDRSLVGVGLNYELYNQNFQKITEDYQSKLRTIGEHIFRIKTEDIAPAVKAARVTYEDAHSLPIEMDLKRLSARSTNLDETLTLLKTSRLDDVVHSLYSLEQTLDAYTESTLSRPENIDSLTVQGLAVSSATGLTVLSGHAAMRVQGDQAVALDVADESLAPFHGEAAQQRISQQVPLHRHRPLQPDEVVRLGKAAASLAQQSLISADALALFNDFMGSGKLSTLEI